MIDFHSHVLPGMDDGSRSRQESMEMLRSMWQQGTRIVCATPHFYREDETIPHFLSRREASFEKLRPLLTEQLPELKLLPGAEIAYRTGISGWEELDRLTLGGSRLLLLEMPEAPWNDGVLRELQSLASSGRHKLILAHAERFLPYQKESVLQRVRGQGILLQTNASQLLRLSTRGRTVKALEHGQLDLIGSDAHNTDSRPPRLGKAGRILRRRLGADYLRSLDELGMSLLTY